MIKSGQAENGKVKIYGAVGKATLVDSKVPGVTMVNHQDGTKSLGVPQGAPEQFAVKWKDDSGQHTTVCSTPRVSGSDADKIVALEARLEALEKRP